jgi:amino acid transporter
MMPVNGGYYQWVKKALGPHWGFCEGWWTWLYTFVDLAIYPVLFVTYAGFLIPGFDVYKIPVCLIIIWVSAALNIWGIVPVGRVSVVLSAVVLIPFLILFVLAFQRHTGPLSIPSPSLKGVAFPSLGIALYTIMWNCFGWDSVTTYADEVEKPVRSYLISIAIAFVLVIAIYVLIVLISQQWHINYKTLNDNGYPVLGSLIGGHWLGALIAWGGMASTLGLYTANLLSVSRLPKAMANDKLLHNSLNRLHPKHQTPYISIITCSAVVSLMVLWTFKDLIIIDVTVYGAGLFLEYASLIKLRITAPEAHRPFKIPLGIKGICLLVLLPVGVYIIGLTGVFLSADETVRPAIFAVCALLSAEVAWHLITWKKPYLKKNNEALF